jgi:hypothetical protein
MTTPAKQHPVLLVNLEDGELLKPGSKMAEDGEWRIVAREEWHDLRAAKMMLEAVERRLGEIAPEACCPHDDGRRPCLSCAIAWIEQRCRPSSC